jgi:3-oxoacyl-[acyl-carrier protein] reductase
MLKEKNVIITGANRGIGRATVELFAKNRANIWACARKQNYNFEMEMRDIASRYGIWIKSVYFDLSNDLEIKEAIRLIIQEKVKIDILINNAGIAHGSLLQMTTLQPIKEVFEVNFFSQILMIQLVSRIMMRQKSGSIVNLSSVLGLDSYQGTVAYGSSKAAVAFATKTISQELAQYNIRVNAVAPGLTRTNMMEQMESGAKSEVIQSTGMKRVADPNEIANAILFLASDNASFITGQILRVDGGV